MSKIRVLTEDTINKIAAGEVIENPSSVVKELVENSLDAGASEITIEIKGGGRQLIRVTDNGCGMNSDDALLCLERHATSKLKEIDDIHSLDTMGFRGEAIPSIASISKFTLLTRIGQKGTQGTMILMDGGKIVKCCPVECAAGTSIEVKSLFFNVPVRKKFQKSPAYDISEINRMIIVLALGNPQIKFQLISNQETLLSSSENQTESMEKRLGNRISQVLGKDYFQSVIPLSGSKGEYKIEGFIGLPACTKHNRTGQFLFINRRGVLSPLVNFSIREGYGTALASGRHPLYVLHLTMPGGLVDVNVHPQKKEVRLRQESALKELIIRSVEESLQKGGYTPAISFEPIANEPSLSTTYSVAPQFSLSPPKEPFPIGRPSYHQKPESLPSFSPIPLKMTEQALFADAVPQKIGPKVLGILPKYIIASTQETTPTLCLIDQRAAHTRVIYERLLNGAAQGLDVQSLLIPYTIDIPSSEACLLREHLANLQVMGIHIKEFGQNTFVIDALPPILGNIDIAKWMDELLNNLHAFPEEETMDGERKRKIAQEASRAAVSSEKKLTLDEAQTLVEQLMNCASPRLCPFGKPTMITLAQQDIAKYFMESK